MAAIKYAFKKKIGKTIHNFSIEGDTLHEVVMNSKKLSFPDVEKCGLCGSDNLDLTAHVAKKKFHYTLIKCNSCKGYLNFGQQIEDPSIFYLRTVEVATGNGTRKVLDWQKSDTPMEEN